MMDEFDEFLDEEDDVEPSLGSQLLRSAALLGVGLLGAAIILPAFQPSHCCGAPASRRLDKQVVRVQGMERLPDAAAEESERP